MSTAGPPLLLDAPAGMPSWLHWFYFLGRFFVDHVVVEVRRNLSPEVFSQALVFLVLLVVAYYAGRLLEKALRKSVLRPPRIDVAVGRLLGHLVVFAFVLVGFSIGLGIFGTSLAAFATGLGLLTLALGFGMQNTVANLMGGISLAVDKPFRPGDRIQVGEYWGTVQTIGLRSTKILTPRKEVVIVPNKILEEREIWNYTMFSSEFRLDLDIRIGFDSDWRRAEEILLAVATEHPNTLRFRPPQVMFRSFEESGVQLQLRTWLADVTVRAETQSDLLKAVKDRFDLAGIEIPFPHRSIRVTNADAPPRRSLADLKPFARTLAGQDRILIAIADPYAAQERAGFFVSLAKALGSGIIAVYVEDSDDDGHHDDAEFAMRVLGEEARDQRVWFKPLMRVGPIVETIRAVTREERADLILIGGARARFMQLWRRQPDIGARLQQELRRPVVTVPSDLQLRPEFVEELRGQMQEYRAQRETELAKEQARKEAPEARPDTSEPVPPT